MVETLSETEPKAIKDHACMACTWLLEHWGDFPLSIAELREVVKAKRRGYMIKKGDFYINQRNICDGVIYTYKAIPAIHYICIKHEVWADY